MMRDRHELITTEYRSQIFDRFASSTKNAARRARAVFTKDKKLKKRGVVIPNLILLIGDDDYISA